MGGWVEGIADLLLFSLEILSWVSPTSSSSPSLDIRSTVPPPGSKIDFPNTYRLDSDLSTGSC